MPTTRIAKLFKNGAGQAVRLPAKFRFGSDEVYVTRDERTGDVVLSNQPCAQSWAEFFDFMTTVPVPIDFMADRPLNAPCSLLDSELGRAIAASMADGALRTSS